MKKFYSIAAAVMWTRYGMARTHLVVLCLIMALLPTAVVGPTGVYAQGLHAYDEGLSPEQIRLLGQIISTGKFIDIFSRADELGSMNGIGNYIVSDAVSFYQAQCCKNPSKFLEVLKNDGFQIGATVENEYYRQRGYDAIVPAERWASLVPHPFANIKYTVIIYFKDNVLVKITAKRSSVAL